MKDIDALYNVIWITITLIILNILNIWKWPEYNTPLYFVNPIISFLLIWYFWRKE